VGAGRCLGALGAVLAAPVGCQDDGLDLPELTWVALVGAAFAPADADGTFTITRLE